MLNVVLKSKRNLHYATGLYGEGKLTVLKGSKINLVDSFPEMSQNLKEMRSNRELVAENGELLRGVEFTSPSSAAQFVTGRSVNGYIAWRPDDKMSLKEYMRDKK